MPKGKAKEISPANAAYVYKNLRFRFSWVKSDSQELKTGLKSSLTEFGLGRFIL
jgi:hypothetical protein